MDIKPQIDQLGAKLVAVGTGSQLFAKKFQEGLAFPGDVYRDPDAAIFKELKLPRLGMMATMARFFLNPSALMFYNSLKGKYAASDMEGDGQQTGGVFVISPEGKILYGFKENDADPETFADNKAILAALTKYAESKGTAPNSSS